MLKHTVFGSYDPNWKSPWEIQLETKLAAYDLKAAVRRFWELVDKEEESDNGRVFKPNKLTISSCRCLDGVELGRLIKRIKELTDECS